MRRARSRRGSVIVIVMITLLLATFALVTFMEKASVDLLVEQREALSRRLRAEAYSALEMTLGVLKEFQEAGNGLRSPAEGWGDPLAFAGYVPSDDRVVAVQFEDESGKISLPRSNAQLLTNLFKYWGMTQLDSEALADVLQGWMRRNHVYSSTVQPNYEGAAIPYLAPWRSLRSFSELAAIEKVRETFYDAEGRPNDLWKRFVACVSLFDFARPNINGARADTLAALGQFNETQQRNLDDYLRGAGNYAARGPNFFPTPGDAQQIAGPTGDTGAFTSTISALRITVTVRDGKTEFRMSVVVAPPSGATTVQTTASTTRAETSAAGAQNAAQQNRPNAAQTAVRPGTNPAGAQSNANARNLRYPFTLLEIRENDEIPPPPPASPANSLI